MASRSRGGDAYRQINPLASERIDVTKTPIDLGMISENDLSSGFYDSRRHRSRGFRDKAHGYKTFF